MLLLYSTEALIHSDQILPADLNTVHAMEFASFVLKVNVIYSASPNESGTIDFNVEASVQVMPTIMVPTRIKLLEHTNRTMVVDL